MKTSNTIRTIAAVCSVAGLTPTFAQAVVTTESTATLPVVVVSADAQQGPQKSSTLATGQSGSAMDTPFSVTTVSGDRVQEQAGTTLQDALRNVPGAQADSGFNGSHTQFFILRGAVTDSGTGSNRVLRDGVRLSNYPYTPAFVESVDVLRGPGAAVGVRSEPGGTVNIATKQPQLRNFGSASAGVGSDGALELSVDINRVLSQEDELSARVTATRSNASEWRHVADKLDGLKLGVAKGDGNRYHLRAGVELTNQTYQSDYGVPSLNGHPVDVPRDRQFGEPFGDSTTNNRIVDVHGDFALLPHTRLAADLTHMEAASTSIKNGLNGNPLVGQPAGTYARFSAWEPDTKRLIDSFSTSLTSEQRAGGLQHKLFVALDYYKETLNQPALSGAALASPNINVFNPVYGLVAAPAPGAVLNRSLTTQNLEAVALSVQDQIDLHAWSIVAGLRFDKQSFVYGGVGTLPIDEARWSPKLAALYRVNDNHTVYANASTGTSANQVSSSNNQSLPSRRSWQAELGWKSTWQGGRMASDLAVFQLNQSNMISSDLSTPLNNFDFTVAGSARSQGVEASVTGDLTDQWKVSANYAYTDAKYLENAVYGGKDVPNVARHTLNLWAQYSWNAEWKTGMGVYAQSDRFADEANTTLLPGYGRFDVVQTWAKKLDANQSFEMKFAVRNLWDSNYYVSSHLHVARWVTPAQGRNVQLTGTYRF